MEVVECLRRRRTVRRFKNEPVPESVVTKILQAARWAPSSRNQQPWHLIVVRDRGTLVQIGRTARTGSFIGEATLAVAVAMENADSPELDAGRALQQMELMAWSEGMGTCFVTLTDAERVEVKRLLEIPPEIDLMTVLPFGYRPGDFKGRGVSRRSLSEIAHGEKFGNPYPSH